MQKINPACEPDMLPTQIEIVVGLIRSAIAHNRIVRDRVASAKSAYRYEVTAELAVAQSANQTVTEKLLAAVKTLQEFAAQPGRN